MVKREDFHLMQWSMGIPLCEDVWLGMQLRNIAIVDLGVLRDIELQAMQSYFADDRVDGNILMLLSATSQMWVFSLYEFMRTWRSKAKHILKTAVEYQTVAPRKKKKFLQQILDNAEGKHKFVRIAPNFYHEQLSKIDDPAFVASVQKYFDDTAGLFSEVSFLRVALAKHEVEGKPGFAAEAPGYGRMSYWTGSLYWHLVNKDGYQERVERVELADAFLGIEPDITDEERYGDAYSHDGKP
jgi:hypothetical protein